MFKALDADGDGKLTAAELQVVYQQHDYMDVSAEEIQAIFDKIDTAKTGHIDYSEFIVAAIEPRVLTAQDNTPDLTWGCGISELCCVSS